jgi:hypothetical protein
VVVTSGVATCRTQFHPFRSWVTEVHRIEPNATLNRQRYAPVYSEAGETQATEAIPRLPAFPHTSGRWAKKIKGELVYFGPWADPEKALEKYRDHLAAAKAAKSKKPGSRDQPRAQGPDKPYVEFPLIARLQAARPSLSSIA